MRVLHVIGAMDCAGTETFLMNLYHNIDRNKVQFDFVVHTEKQMFYEKEIFLLGGKIFRVPQFKGYNIFTYKKWWDNFFNNHQEYAIVHGHIGSTASIYLSVANKYNYYTIAHSHATHEKGISLMRIEFALATCTTRYIADYFMACSKQAGIDRYGKKIVNSDCFQVINNGIECDKYIFSNKIRDKVRKSNNIDQNTIIIGHVGRFTEAKNHKKIIDVFNCFHKKHQNAVLWLFGEGELKQEIEDKVKELRISRSVCFKGLSSHISEELQAMDVFLFPSLFEGLGIALIEAQASGLPCVVSNAIQDEADIKAGLIKKLDLNLSDDKWASALEEMLHRNRVDTSAYVKQAGFDIKSVANKLQNFYLETLNNRNKSNI